MEKIPYINQLPSAPLPRAIPPLWMKRSLLLSSLLFIILSLITLSLPIEDKIPTTGFATFQKSLSVHAPEYARVSKIFSGFSQDVKKDTPLAQLENPDLSEKFLTLTAELETARADVAAAESRLRQINAAPLPTEYLFSDLDYDTQSQIASLQRNFLKKLQSVETSGASSQVELLNFRLQLIISEARLRKSQSIHELIKGTLGNAIRDEAQARLDLALAREKKIQDELTSTSQRIANLEILAPDSGRLVAITQRNPGEWVNAGEKLFEIATSPPNQLLLKAPVKNFHLIQKGTPVRFRAANDPSPLSPPARASISEIRRYPENPTFPLEKTSPSKPHFPSIYLLAEIESTPAPIPLDVPVNAEIILTSKPLWQKLILHFTTPN